MSLDAGQWPEVGPDSGSAQGGGDRLLFTDGEQQVRLYTDDQRLLELGAAQDFHVIAVFAEVEAIDGA